MFHMPNELEFILALKTIFGKREEIKIQPLFGYFLIDILIFEWYVV